jgi:hypothetical protein
LYFKIILNEKEVAVSRKYTALLMQKNRWNPQDDFKAEILDFSNQDVIFPPAEELFVWSCWIKKSLHMQDFLIN